MLEKYKINSNTSSQEALQVLLIQIPMFDHRWGAAPSVYRGSLHMIQGTSKILRAVNLLELQHPTVV